MPPRGLQKALPATTTESVSIESTVGTFADRMKRRLREQEQAESERAKARAEQQSLLLKGVNLVRRALTEATKVQLGDRFSLDFDVTDWEGWPRLELLLVDQKGIASDLSLIVLATNRGGPALINFMLRSEEALARIELQDEADLARLPAVVKRSLRLFLDLVSERVLNPNEQAQSNKVGPRIADVSTEDHITEKHLARVDFFCEEIERDENRVKAGTVAPIDI